MRFANACQGDMCLLLQRGDKSTMLLLHAAVSMLHLITKLQSCIWCCKIAVTGWFGFALSMAPCRAVWLGPYAELFGFALSVTPCRSCTAYACPMSCCCCKLMHVEQAADTSLCSAVVMLQIHLVMKQTRCQCYVVLANTPMSC